MPSKKPDWIKIENEYVTSNISLRKLAEKYNVSFNTLKDRATKEKWNLKRTETHNRITTETQQKTIEKTSEVLSDRNARFLKISDMALDVVENYLKNNKQNDFVIKTKSCDEDGSFMEGFAEVTLKAVNTKAFAEMIKSLEVVQKGQRTAEGLDDPNTKPPETVDIKYSVTGITPEEI